MGLGVLSLTWVAVHKFPHYATGHPATFRVVPNLTPFEITTSSGQRFEVTQRADHPGQYGVEWLTGPNEGYGFSPSGSDNAPIDVETLTQMCEHFLAEVNPETGYLE